MTQNLAYVISIKFAPGSMKEFILIGEKLRSKGINIKYLLSEEYGLLNNKPDNALLITKSQNLRDILLETARLLISDNIDKLFHGQHVAFVLFYNNHILNLFIARNLKKQFKNVRTLHYYHDPYKPDKRSYGIFKGLYISFVEFIVRLTLKYIDHVILGSEFSYELFKSHYKQYRGQIHIAPLLIPDQGYDKNHHREFFSIAGAYNNATGHDDFINLVNYAAEKQLNYKFALISSSNISELLKKLSNAGQKIIRIINNKLINDFEINEVIRNSYAVFRLDKEVTQSGVIPVSYMNATPIIARDIPGLTQHVRHGHEGYIVPCDCTAPDLINAMSQVIDNYPHLSMNARHSYDTIWSEHNFDRYYNWLLSMLKY
jgi:glycosyltransferase involved in cell wall biosynthesis